MRKNNKNYNNATKKFDSYKPVTRKEFDSLKGRVDAIDASDIVGLACDMVVAMISLKLAMKKRKRFEDLENKTAELEKKLKDFESKAVVEAETAADAEDEK